MARVSVVVVTYDQARFLPEALGSVLAQTFTDYEVVVVDDASSDGSVAVVEEWAARHGVDVTLVAHSSNTGPCRSLNDGIARARGEYVALLSGDDAWLPRKLEVQVAQLDALPAAVGVAYGDAYLMDESGDELPGRFVETHRSFDAPPEGDLFEVLLESNFIPGPATLFRRRCLEETGAFDESLAYEDWDFWIRFAARFRFAYTPEVLARYRVVTNSLVRSLGVRGNESDLRMYRKALGVRPAADPYIRSRIAGLAEWLYHSGGGSRRRYAWLWWRYGGDRRVLKLALRELVRPGRS